MSSFPSPSAYILGSVIIIIILSHAPSTPLCLLHLVLFTWPSSTLHQLQCLRHATKLAWRKPCDVLPSLISKSPASGGSSILPGDHTMPTSSVLSAEWLLHTSSRLKPPVPADDPASFFTENISNRKETSSSLHHVHHLPESRPIDLPSLLATMEELSQF